MRTERGGVIAVARVVSEDTGIDFEDRHGLAAEAVERAALALERVDDVHGGDGLAAGVLGVRHGIADDVLEEHLEHRASLLVDQTGDALDATSASETADGGLGDALDVVAQHLAMALGAALSEALASLATSGHLSEEYPGAPAVGYKSGVSLGACLKI